MSNPISIAKYGQDTPTRFLNKSVYVLFFALIAALFVHVAVYEGATSNNTLNLYHVLIAITYVVTFRLRPAIIASPETVFFVVLTTTSVLGWSVHGFHTRGVLLPLIFLAFAVGNRWQQLTTAEQRLVTYKRIFAFVLAVIAIRNLVYFESLGAIYSRTRIDTPAFILASGGRNLEATQLGMLSTLLIGTTAFFPAIVVAAVTSVLMMSRAGILAVLISLLLWLIHGKFGRMKFYAGGLVLSAGILACLINFEGSYRVPIIDRFDISTERDYAAADQGRLAIWGAACDVLSDNPLGYGVGNGFPKLNEHLGGHLRENNAHNVFVEFAVDGGLQSSILFAAILLSTVFARGLIDSPARRFVLAYGLLGLVEFTGYDAIGWFFIGVAHASRFRLTPNRTRLS